MTHIVKLLALVLALLAFHPALAQQQNKALVIGISQYQEIDSLRYADSDATEFSQVLTDYGQYAKDDVIILLNQQATKAKIVAAINKLVKESAKQPFDNFVFMFAGHGVENTLVAGNAKGRHNTQETNMFLAPFDASIDDSNFYTLEKRGEVSNETFINKAWLARQLSAIQAKSIVIILDSCYSGTKSFGTLFTENEGYEIESFSAASNLRNDDTNSHQKRSLRLIKTRSDDISQNRKVAFFASSRDDQASAEYDELRHGALSYCILEYIKRIRRETPNGTSATLSIEDVYNNIEVLFRETIVNGKPLEAQHQPILIPIPDYSNMKGMVFMNVKGVASPIAQGSYSDVIKKELATGILNIKTYPSGLDIYVDGVKLHGQASAQTQLKLTEGKHSIELFMPQTGYKVSFVENIMPGASISKDFDLRGKLEVLSFWIKEGVKSAGPELEILLDNKIVDTSSNISLDNIIAGTHLIEVRYKSISKSRHIEIRPDSPLKINYSIIQEGAANAPIEKKSVRSVVF